MSDAVYTAFAIAIGASSSLRSFHLAWNTGFGDTSGLAFAEAIRASKGKMGRYKLVLEMILLLPIAHLGNSW